MTSRTGVKLGIGAGVVALVAAAGLVVASPVAAQGANGIASVVQIGAGFQHRGGPGFGFGRGIANLSTIATALNMTEAELRTELQAGKSVADVASAKGVALDTVVNAVADAYKQTLDQAVADGRITQAQADTLLANLRATLPGHLQVRPVTGLGGSGFGKGGRGKGGFGVKGVAPLSVIAPVLNMTEAELRTELQAGKSIADVAGEKGVSLDAVSDAIVKHYTDQLTQAVTNGRLTQAQADALIATLRENLPELLALKGMPGLRWGPGKVMPTVNTPTL